MSPSAMAPFDWRGWRADVVERLDRRWIGAALAYAAVAAAVRIVGDSAGHERAAFIFYTLTSFSMVMLALAALAVALVAVARGTSAWVAYAVAGLALAAAGTVLGIVIEANCGCPARSLHVMIVAHPHGQSLLLVPAAVLYVYASNAAHDQKVLRVLEAERVAEADRLAQQRLNTELATVDHDLVLSALRLALSVRAHDAAQAQALLEAVTAYLRLAQQRGSSEPGRIAGALGELRQACASRGRVLVQQASA